MDFNAEAIAAASTGFHARYLIGMEDGVDWHLQLVDIVESTNEQETIHLPEGVGNMREWTGALEEKPSIRWSLTIVNKDWENTLEVPVNRFKDDKLGVYKAQAEMLGASATDHPAQLVTDFLVAGFTESGYDDVPFFSNSHPLANGATQDNLVTGALNATRFEEAVALLDSMTDWYGAPLKVKSRKTKKYLMVGPTNRATAKTIVESATISGGDGNPNYKEAEIIINENLIGARANYWFVLRGSGPVRPIFLQMREKPEFLGITDPTHPSLLNQKKVIFNVQGRWNVGFGFYQLAVGSTGS